MLPRLVNRSVLLSSVPVPENFVRQSIVIDSRETKHHFLLFSVLSHVVALSAEAQSSQSGFFPAIPEFLHLSTNSCTELTEHNFQFWSSCLKKMVQRLIEMACRHSGFDMEQKSHVPVNGVSVTS